VLVTTLCVVTYLEMLSVSSDSTQSVEKRISMRSVGTSQVVFAQVQ
jgi:hypothetical protein